MSLRSKIITYTDGSGFFWFAISAIALVALSYIYAVNKTVILVAERRSLESKISANHNDISNLESSYINERNNITFELAQSLGYGEAHEVVYVSKKSVSVLTRAETIQ